MAEEKKSPVEEALANLQEIESEAENAALQKIIENKSGSLQRMVLNIIKENPNVTLRSDVFHEEDEEDEEDEEKPEEKPDDKESDDEEEIESDDEEEIELDFGDDEEEIELDDEESDDEEEIELDDEESDELDIDPSIFDEPDDEDEESDDEEEIELDDEESDDEEFELDLDDDEDVFDGEEEEFELDDDEDEIYIKTEDGKYKRTTVKQHYAGKIKEYEKEISSMQKKYNRSSKVVGVLSGRIKEQKKFNYKLSVMNKILIECGKLPKTKKLEIATKLDEAKTTKQVEAVSKAILKESKLTKNPNDRRTMTESMVKAKRKMVENGDRSKTGTGHVSAKLRRMRKNAGLPEIPKREK
jgi:hypothetical protein